MKQSLFDFVDAPDHLNPDFLRVATAANYGPARQLMSEIWDDFDDLDGNFVEEFQTAGFDARLFELYLFAFLRGAGMEVEQEYEVPDFVGSFPSGDKVGIEAVTANPSGNDMQNVGSMAKPLGPSDVKSAQREFTKKLMRAVRSKLKKKYWELPQMSGRPFIVAVQNFSYADSLQHSGSMLMEELYGVEECIEDGQPALRKHCEGLFDREDAENLAAVVFCNQGTVAKFSRMAQQSQYYDPRIKLTCVELVHDHSPEALKPLVHQYTVGVDEFRDSWGRGTLLLHNPNARLSLRNGVFDECAEYIWRKGKLLSTVPPFYPYVSKQWNLLVQE